MKKILVPTDFSKDAENALRVAANLTKKFKNYRWGSREQSFHFKRTV